MRLRRLKEGAYGDRLYKMPSDAVIEREAKWGGGNFADLKREYEVLWRTRRSLHKLSTV
jgi:hypothetical protein